MSNVFRTIHGQIKEALKEGALETRNITLQQGRVVLDFLGCVTRSWRVLALTHEPLCIPM